MAERRVPEVVGQAGGVDDVRVAAEPLAHLASDLGDLDRVREAGTQKVVRTRGMHLGLRREAAKRRRMQHARAIALER
jgi:hypothetical protein